MGDLLVTGESEEEGTYLLLMRRKGGKGGERRWEGSGRKSPQSR